MRVVVAEDVMLTREGIVHLLGDAGIEVAGAADDADGLLRLVQEQRPDVAITDIRMPPTHTDEGLAAAARIRSEFPATGVLVLRSGVSRAGSGPARQPFQGRRCLATPGWAPGAFLPVFGRPRAAHPGRRTSQRLSPAPAGPARTPHSLTALAAD